MLFTVLGMGPMELTPPVDKITLELPARVNCAVPAEPEVALNLLMDVLVDATVLTAASWEDSMAKAPPVEFDVGVASEIAHCESADVPPIPVDSAGKLATAELVLCEL